MKTSNGEAAELRGKKEHFFDGYKKKSGIVEKINIINIKVQFKKAAFFTDWNFFSACFTALWCSLLRWVILFRAFIFKSSTFHAAK